MSDSKIKPTLGNNIKFGKNIKFDQFLEIGDNGNIGDNVELGLNVKIASNVSIGDNVIVGDNVKVWEGVSINNDTIIESNCEIGYSRLTKKKKYFEDFPTTIGQNCIIRAGSIIYRACKIGDNSWIGNYTIIRENTLIGNHTTSGSHIMCEGYSRFGSNVKVYSFCELGGNMEVEDLVFIGPGIITANNPRPIVAINDETTYRWDDGKRRVADQGPKIKAGAKIGIAATLLAEIEIGNNALIAAGSVVTKNVAENAIVRGIPAKQVGEVPEEERTYKK